VAIKISFFFPVTVVDALIWIDVPAITHASTVGFDVNLPHAGDESVLIVAGTTAAPLGGGTHTLTSVPRHTGAGGASIGKLLSTEPTGASAGPPLPVPPLPPPSPAAGLAEKLQPASTNERSHARMARELTRSLQVVADHRPEVDRAVRLAEREIVIDVRD